MASISRIPQTLIACPCLPGRAGTLPMRHQTTACNPSAKRRSMTQHTVTGGAQPGGPRRRLRVPRLGPDVGVTGEIIRSDGGPGGRWAVRGAADMAATACPAFGARRLNDGILSHVSARVGHGRLLIRSRGPANAA